MSRTSRNESEMLIKLRHYPLFKPQQQVSKFLASIVRGRFDEIQQMLQSDVGLIFKKGSVTDCSG